MKIFKLLLFTALISLTISCSKDDDKPSQQNNGDIVGVWKGTTVDYSGTSETSGQGQNITSTFNGEAYDVNYTLTFTEDPNKVVSDGSYSVELTTTTNGQTVTQNLEGLEFLSSGDWAISGNSLSVTVNNETDDMTIVQLSDDTLVLKGQDITTMSQGGFTFTSTTNIILTFTKQ